MIPRCVHVCVGVNMISINESFNYLTRHHTEDLDFFKFGDGGKYRGKPNISDDKTTQILHAKAKVSLHPWRENIYVLQ